MILLCDSFLGPFDPAVLAAAARVLTRMGFAVLHTPILRNSKAAEVRGYLDDFDLTKARAGATLDQLSSTGLALINLEPAVSMHYRQNIPVPLAGSEPIPIDRFLVRHKKYLPQGFAGDFEMIGHCTETSADPESLGRWEDIFSAGAFPQDPTGRMLRHGWTFRP